MAGNYSSAPNYMNPYLGAGLNFAGNFLGGLGGAIFGSPERDLAKTQNEMLRQKMGYLQGLYPMLMRMYKSGHSISPLQQERSVGQFGQAMQPEFMKALSMMGRTGDVRNPVMQRNFSQVLFPAMAGYRQQLGEMDMQGMAQLRQLLASLAG